MYNKLLTCLKSIREKTDFKPHVGIILGSGLGAYAEEIEVEAVINYDEIDGFPTSTVAGHKGRFVFGYVRGVPVVIMQGRVHYYEGYAMSDVVLPTRIMGMLGIKKLLLTNAAGGVNTSFSAGDLMMITDQIATFVPNPLLGRNIDDFGARFPDMSEIYSKKLRECILSAASKCNINLKQGVYMQLTGPSYESPAEVRMCRILGGDAVGMSTACEAIAARHMGIEVCGVSCITNMAAGVLDQQLSHSEVQETADRVAVQFKALVTEIIDEIGHI